MSEIRLNIDGREVRGFEGQTILDIARENNIEIPTLCHDERVEMYGSCGLCVVEAEGVPKLLRSCSTFASNGMIINTSTARVRSNRKAALELLLSDHTGDCRPPCVLACPAQTDCQGYVGLIANGEYNEALKLLKDKIPLPASIGRVCPHPCEDACRRKLVEEPISIAALKQFVGDINLAQGEAYAAEVGASTGKSVAIIGGGPGGLSAAYYLRTMGHSVTVYDKMPRMGGMLRYGIPEYRLPKRVLQDEIRAIEKMGVKFCNNVKIGRDLALDYLREAYDAVIIAVGAWSSMALGCPGEDLGGVHGGIEFLRYVAVNNPVFTGRRIAVVGGGNTAMDACRTAVRLGASEVYNIYRRTKSEMPAEDIEIKEAEEEGVIFKNLTNPIEIIGNDGQVTGVRLQIMELGEPDASGRRSPVPVPGKEVLIEVDTMIIAIGQKLSPNGFEALERTRRGNIAADEHTFLTSIDGVFAIGDATNKGADIAISAIGEAKHAAEMVDKYLSGEELKYEPNYLVKSEKSESDFENIEKYPRAKMPHRPADERRNDFMEVNLGLSETEAKKEASRCLECGCHDYFECKLIGYANQYSVQPEKFDGKVHHHIHEDDHPFIHRNPDKCILCGLCVRICDEVVGATALGLVDRGFDTVVKPALDTELRSTDCISCGQCVSVCPTGALTETMMIPKQVPIKESFTETVCSFCSVGCKTRLASKGGLLTRSLPSAEKDSLLCMKGRFGFGEIAKKKRLTYPLIKAEKGMKKTTFEQAVINANKSLQSLQTQFGNDCIAVAVSDRYTNEEAFLIKEYANKALKTCKVFSLNRVSSGLADVFGSDASTATIEELDNTELIVIIASDLMKNHGVAGMRIKRAVKSGARLLTVSTDTPLPEIIKALLNKEKGKGIDGYDELLSSVKDIVPSEESIKYADTMLKARKAVFVFEKTAVTTQAAQLIANIAVLSGHGGEKPRDGIIQLLPGANSQGLTDLGFGSGDDFFRSIAAGEIRGLFIFGEDISGIDLSTLDFLAVQDIHMTETARYAHVVFPASSFAEVSGSYTGADGTVRKLKPAVVCPVAWDNIAQVNALAAHAGLPMPYRSVGDISAALAKINPEGGNSVKLSPVTDDFVLCRSGFQNTNELSSNLLWYAARKGVRC